jgi:hypothetical protein
MKLACVILILQSRGDWMENWNWEKSGGGAGIGVEYKVWHNLT